MTSFGKLSKLMACLTIAFSANVGAAVIDSADVAGLRTFQDTNTGRIWLDMNNFFNMSTSQMLTIANAAGFTFATRSDVDALLGSLPLNGGQWPGYKAVMGDAPNRELIWGSYDDGGDPSVIGWAWSYGNETAWTISDNIDGIGNIPNSGEFTDLNVWAYQTGTPVPEPASLALLGIGLAGLGAMRKRKQV